MSKTWHSETWWSDSCVDIFGPADSDGDLEVLAGSDYATYLPVKALTELQERHLEARRRRPITDGEGREIETVDSDGMVLDPAPTVHEWFGLTRSSYLVLPRLALQAMPEGWQRRFVEMLNELSEAVPGQPDDYVVLRDEPGYTLKVSDDPDDEHSRVSEFHAVTEDPWSDYRRDAHGVLKGKSDEQ